MIWQQFLSGILVGWLLEYAWDRFYWREHVVDPDFKADYKALRAENAKLKELAEAPANADERVVELKAKLTEIQSESSTEITRLRAENDAVRRQMMGDSDPENLLNKMRAELDATRAQAEAEIQRLRAELATKESTEITADEANALAEMTSGDLPDTSSVRDSDPVTQAKITALESALAQAQAQAESHAASFNQNNEVLSSIMERVGELEDELSHAQSGEPSGLSVDVTALQLEVERLQRALVDQDTLNAQLEEAENKLQVVSGSQVEVEHLKDEIARLNTEAGAASSSASELEDAHTRLQEALQSVELHASENERLKALLKQEGEDAAEVESLKERLALTESHLQAATEAVRERTDAYNTLSDQVQHLEEAAEEVERLKVSLVETEARYQDAMARVQEANLLRSEISDLRLRLEETDSLRARLQLLEERVRDLVEENAQLQASADQAKQLRSEVDHLRGELEYQVSKTESLEAASHEAEQLRLRLKEAEEQILVLEEVKPAEAVSDDSLPQIDALPGKKTRKLQAEIEALMDQNKKAVRSVDAYKDEIVGLQTQLAGLVSPPNQRDPLEKIKGVGPMTQLKLWESGILTFAQFASLRPDQIRAIIDDRNGLADVERWIVDANRFARGGS